MTDPTANPTAYALQAHLSALNEEFLREAGKDDTYGRRSSYGPLDEPHPLLQDDVQSWPLFVDEARARELDEASWQIARLVRSLVSRSAEGRLRDLSLQGMGALARATPAAALTDDATAHAISRQDIFVSPTGPKVLECNIVGSVGGWEAALWISRLVQCDPVRRFLESRGQPPLYVDNLDETLTHVIEATTAWLEQPDEVVNLVVAANVGANPMAAQMMAQFLEWRMVELTKSLGVTPGAVQVCPPEQLSLRDGGIFAGTCRAHAVLDFNMVRLPATVIEASLERKVCLFNGPAGHVLSDKTNLALLSEAADRGDLSSEDTALVQRYLPWTRRLRDGETTRGGVVVRLLDHVERQRKDLVLKPGFGASGQGIVIGAEASETAWRAAVARARAGRSPWIVQEAVSPTGATFQSGAEGHAPHRVVMSSFAMGARRSVGFARLQPDAGSRIINATRGAQVQFPLFVPETDSSYPARPVR